MARLVDIRIQQAWEKGFGMFAEQFPDALNPIVREAAFERFRVACQGKTEDSRFEGEAPNQAKLLLCHEAVKFYQAVKSA